MNKKGNFPDVAEYIKVALVLTLTIVIVMLFLRSWNAGVVSLSNETVSDEIKTGSTELNTSLYKGFDWLFLAVFLVFVSFSVVMARIIPSSPMFIVVSVVSLVLLPFVAMLVENVFYSWSQNANISVVLANMPILNYFIGHFTIFVFLYSLVVAIALLTKSGGVSSG